MAVEVGLRKRRNLGSDEHCACGTVVGGVFWTPVCAIQRARWHTGPCVRIGFSRRSAQQNRFLIENCNLLIRLRSRFYSLQVYVSQGLA